MNERRMSKNKSRDVHVTWFMQKSNAAARNKSRSSSSSFPFRSTMYGNLQCNGDRQGTVTTQNNFLQYYYYYYYFCSTFLLQCVRNKKKRFELSLVYRVRLLHTIYLYLLTSSVSFYFGHTVYASRKNIELQQQGQLNLFISLEIPKMFWGNSRMWTQTRQALRGVEGLW